jgi:L-amino acid N-acyltransferase YncA
LTAGRFARSVEGLTTYTEALWKTVHPEARHRWRAAEPRYDPVVLEMDFSAPHAAQTEQRQVYRQAVAAPERVHQAWRQRGSGPAVPDITTAERP